MFRFRTILPTTLAFGFLAVSCSKKTAGDDALATDIKANLYSNASTRAAAIGVAVAGGVVTLTGNVPSSDVELEAMKVANGTAGVRSVSDQLKVNSAMAQLPDAGTPAPQNPVNAVPSPSAYSQPVPSPQSSSIPAPPTATAPVTSEPEPGRPEPVRSPEPMRPPQPVTWTVPAGAQVSIRTIDSIDSHTNDSGQTFRATVSSPLTSQGEVVIPAGEPATVLLTDARGAGRLKGRSELGVRLSRIEYRGHSYPVNSSVYEEVGKARGKSTVVKTGVGAAVGGIIGALAGGGKGAAIGSAAGGGIGLGESALTHGQQMRIPSETILTFRLEAPLVVNR